MPIVKKKKHAEEEEEDEEIYTQHESSGSEEGSEQEEEVLEEEEEEDQYEEDGISNDEEELPTTSKSLKDHAENSKRNAKRKNSEAKTPPSKKGKPSSPVQRDRATGAIKKTSKIAKKTPTKGKVVTVKKPANVGDDGKKVLSAVEYNDKNVDFNLYNEAPEHIKNLKIKISSNVVMLCRMIEATGNTSQGLTYDYAALSFVRQSKNGKAYEFNLPLNLAPCIVKGINLLIKNNPKFFESHANDNSMMNEHE